MAEINKNLVLLGFLVVLMLGIVLMDRCALITTSTQIIEDITPAQAAALIRKNRDNRNFVILDVRTPEEFAAGYIAGAVNLDYYAKSFKDELKQMDKNRKYLVSCRGGVRSSNALGMMKELRFREVYNMLGGATQWQAKGLPVTEHGEE